MFLGLCECNSLKMKLNLNMNEFLRKNKVTNINIVDIQDLWTAFGMWFLHRTSLQLEENERQ